MSSDSTRSATRKRKEMPSSRKFLLNRSTKSRNPQCSPMFCAAHGNQKGKQVKQRLAMHCRRYMSRKRIEGRITPKKANRRSEEEANL